MNMIRHKTYLSISIVLILFLSASFAQAQNHVIDDSKNLRYQFIITGNTGTFKDGKPTLNGTPIVTFYFLGSTREVGHFLVGTFVEMWEKNSSTYKADPPSGTLSVFGEKGSSGAVMQVSNPVSTLNLITFDARVLEGEIPASFNASSFFLKLNVTEPLHTQN